MYFPLYSTTVLYWILPNCPCLCFRGCISNRRMMDSTSSPEPQRMWVFVSLSRMLDTPPTAMHGLKFHNDNESTPQYILNLFSLSFLLQCLSLQSPADQCKKIHAGDEVIQVNHQTVVSYTASKLNTVAIKNHRKCTFHVFPLWIHTANCLSFSILCYAGEMSR